MKKRKQQFKLTPSHLDKKQLAKLLDVTSNTVNQWLSKGCPRQIVDRRVYFHRSDMAEWFARTRSLSRHCFKLTRDGTKAPEPGDTHDKLADALARARAVEESAYEIVQRCPPAEKLLCQEHYAKMSDNRRKLEKDWALIQASLGDVIDRAEASRQLAAIGTELKQSLLSIPSSAAPELENKTTPEAFKILTAAIENALRALAKQLTEVVK